MRGRKYKFPGFWRFLELSPLILPAALASFSLVAMCLLLLGALENILVWPLGLIAAFYAGQAVYKNAPKTSDSAGTNGKIIWDIAVLGWVIIWMAAGCVFASQHIFTNRDPASYVVTGIWLSENPDLDIDRQEVLSSVPNVDTYSSGFSRYDEDPDHLYTRGPHLLPLLLGLSDRIGGLDFLFRANVVLGSIALLTLYGTSRLLVGRKWAVLSVLIMSAALPMIYFSRDAYTEPLSIIFVFGGLSLLYAALTSKSAKLWVVAGLVFGAAALVRIDAFIPIFAIAALMIIYNLLAKPSERIERRKNIAWFSVGLLPPVANGLLDLQYFSGQYFEKRMPLVMAEISAILGLVILGVILIQLSRRSRLLQYLDKHTAKWRHIAAFVSVVLFFLVLASRPLWLEAHNYLGGRSFAELSVNWLMWYLGVALVLAGIIGLALMAARASKKQEIFMTGFLLVVLVTSMIFLVQPKISPDQIWASRRMLPVIMPGIVIGACYFLKIVQEQSSRWSRPLVIATAILFVFFPFSVSGPFLFTRMYVPQLDRIRDVCKNLPENPVVVWVGRARTEAVQPTRLICSVPTAGHGKLFTSNNMPDRATLQLISEEAADKGMIPIIGIYGNDVGLLQKESDVSLSTVHSSTTYNVEQTYRRVPSAVSETETSILLGVINKDGSIKRL